jgi:hypothetical protein
LNGKQLPVLSISHKEMMMGGVLVMDVY